MGHRWRIVGRSKTESHFNSSTLEWGPPTYTTSFICKGCGIHWNAWAQQTIDGWFKDKDAVLVDPEYRGRVAVGSECDPAWRYRIVADETWP